MSFRLRIKLLPLRRFRPDRSQLLEQFAVGRAGECCRDVGRSQDPKNWLNLLVHTVVNKLVRGRAWLFEQASEAVVLSAFSVCHVLRLLHVKITGLYHHGAWTAANELWLDGTL